MLCSSAVLLTSLFAVVRACHLAENGRWYLSGASLCLKHNVALEPDKTGGGGDGNDDDDDRDDSDEEDDENDNDSKADDYDGGNGDNNFFSCSNRERTYRVRVDKAYWRIAGSVA